MTYKKRDIESAKKDIHQFVSEINDKHSKTMTMWLSASNKFDTVLQVIALSGIAFIVKSETNLTTLSSVAVLAFVISLVVLILGGALSYKSFSNEAKKFQKESAAWMSILNPEFNWDEQNASVAFENASKVSSKKVNKNLVWIIPLLNYIGAFLVILGIVLYSISKLNFAQ